MKKNFLSDIRIASPEPGITLQDLRALAKASPAGFMERTQKLIKEGKISLSSIRDLRGLRAVLSDVMVPVKMDLSGLGQRTIMASAFPILVGNLVIAGLNTEYEQIPTIGDQLVTDFEDSKKVTSIAAIHSLDKDIDEVKEGKDFPEISAEEEKVEIRHKRNGRMLTITQEAIDENEIADIVNRINALAIISTDWVEEQTLFRVYDYDGSAASPADPYVYRPNGTGTQLYSASANTPGTRAPSGTRVNNNALADETDLDNARAVLTAMKNSRGKSINIPMSRCIVLVPDALIGKLMKILNSIYVPGVENEKSNWGPEGMWRPKPLSSPKLDDMSTTCWHMGDFKSQFKRKWKLRFEYVTLGQNTESYLKARIAFQARIAWDVEIGAVDYVYVVENLAVATAPKDD